MAPAGRVRTSVPSQELAQPPSRVAAASSSLQQATFSQAALPSSSPAARDFLLATVDGRALEDQ